MVGSTTGAIVGGAIARSAGVQTVFHLWLPILLVAAAAIEIRRRRPAPLQEGGLP